MEFYFAALPGEKAQLFFSFLRKSYERVTEYNSLMVQKYHRKNQLSLVYTLEAFLMEPDLMEPENVSCEPNHHFQVPRIYKSIGGTT